MYSAMNIDEALSLTSGGIVMQLIVVLQAPSSALAESRGGKYIHMVAGLHTVRLLLLLHLLFSYHH